MKILLCTIFAVTHASAAMLSSKVVQSLCRTAGLLIHPGDSHYCDRNPAVQSERIIKLKTS